MKTEYYQARTELEDWKQRQISELQARDAGESEYRSLDEHMCTQVSTLQQQHGVMAEFQHKKRLLESQYWQNLSVAARKHSNDVRALLPVIGVVAESVVYPQMLSDLQTVCDSFELQFSDLQQQYECQEPQFLPRAPKKARRLSENQDYLQQAGETLAEFIARNQREIESKTRSLLENPSDIVLYAHTIDALLNKKQAELDQKVSEGVVWDVVSFPFKLPIWFWQRLFLPLLRRYVTGPIGDFFWYRKIRSIDPKLDPKVAVLNPGTSSEITKQDYDAFTNGVATLAIIGLILSSSELLIPGLGSILRGLYDTVATQVTTIGTWF